MKIGDLVKVNTKFYGDKMGIVLEEVTDDWGTSFLIEPFDHPNQIMADPQDISMITLEKK